MTQHRTLPGAAYAPVGVDEVHVLATGLGPLAAGVCLALAEAGVCLFNVQDPSPVTVADIRQGPYPAKSEAQPRDLVLRRMLRGRSPRCVPLSAPELFPAAAVGTAAVLHSWAVGDPLPAPPGALALQALDPHLPTLTVVSDGEHVISWPVTDWGHRPCSDCLEAAAGEARGRAGDHGPEDSQPPRPDHVSPLAAVTRAVATGEVAGSLLALALGDDAAPGAGLAATPAPAGAEGVHPLVLRRGLVRTALPAHPGCLCSLAFDGP